MPDPTSNPTLASPEPEEAKSIPDHLMVFHSTDDHTTKTSVKEMKLKNKKGRGVARKSTPAPPTKGQGRKRFVPSPLPEDKQLRKKLVFGEVEKSGPANAGTSSGPDSPRCKATLFPACPVDTMEEKGLENHPMEPTIEEEAQMALVSQGNIPAAVNPPTSDHDTAGSEKTVGEDSAKSPCASLEDLADSSVPKSILGSGRVNLPEMGLGPKHLSESAFVPFHSGMSRVVPCSSLPMQQMEPKKSDALQVIDLAAAETLDAAAAQPLLAGTSSGADYTTKTNPHSNTIGIGSGPHMLSIENGPSLEDFPYLERGRTQKIRASFETGSGSARPKSKVIPNHPRDTLAAPTSNMNSEIPNQPEMEMEMEVPRPPDDVMDEGFPSSEPRNVAHHGAGQNGHPTSNPIECDAGPVKKNTDKPKTMADMVRGSTPNEGPQVFVPESIQSIGFASTSNGVPSIYFSGAEIQKLATSLGHAIVGKFSHSIPASSQIQKALDNIKFRRGYTWKYINAKHILVQFEDMADYARLLSGPKGTPVWFIDRHPMRVFKWSADFDAYCESPIAAIWCNLIGLPIHLYDHSALYAIGKLLGTPIQVDRATANKSRLSFARMCIEIDITNPPPDEIILDICGRTVVQQVKWDKIPSYCRECKHVGHTKEVCYAAGNAERPPRRNYNIVPPKQPQHGGNGGNGAKKDKDGPKENDNTTAWKQQGKYKAKESTPRTTSKASGHSEEVWSGPDFLGELHRAGAMDMIIFPDTAEQRGRFDHEQTKAPITRAASSGRGRGGMSKGSAKATCDTAPGPGELVRSKGNFKPFSLDSSEKQGATSHMSTNRYFSLMARENFMEDDMEDREDYDDTASLEGTNDGDKAMHMEAETSPKGNVHIGTEVDGSSTLLLGNKSSQDGHDHQIAECQRGSSHPPGTSSHV